MLKNITCDPSDPMALSDLRLIEPLLTLLGILAKSSTGRKSERISGMYRSCMELFQKAKTAVECTALVNINWNHRMWNGTSPGEESIEEFLRTTGSTSSEYDMELDSIPPDTSRDFAFNVEQQFRGVPPSRIA